MFYFQKNKNYIQINLGHIKKHMNKIVNIAKKMDRIKELDDKELSDLLFMVVSINIFKYDNYNIEKRSIKKLKFMIENNEEVRLSSKNLFTVFDEINDVFYEFNKKEKTVLSNFVYIFLFCGYFENNYLKFPFHQVHFSKDVVEYVIQVIFYNIFNDLSKKEIGDFIIKNKCIIYSYYRVENIYFLLKNNIKYINFDCAFTMFTEMIKRLKETKINNYYFNESINIFYNEGLIFKFILNNLETDYEIIIKYFKKYLSKDEYKTVMLLKNI